MTTFCVLLIDAHNKDKIPNQTYCTLFNTPVPVPISSMMRLFLSFVAAMLLVSNGANSFAPQPRPRTTQIARSSLSMGLFDFFSEDARKEREAARQAEIEEQERIQREILKRRADPDEMEEYMARAGIRRKAIARGEDGDLYKVMKPMDEDE